MKTRYLFILLTLLIPAGLYAQDCQVLLPAIAGKYEGDCNKGKASGKGSSQGKDKYTGEFADGLPNGEGTYTWADGTTYTGSFAKGKMEGKGSMAYKRAGKPDSVVTGYWKKGTYTGEFDKPYTIYARTNKFARIELMRNAKENTNMILIDVETTTGGGSGIASGTNTPVPELTDVVVAQGSFSQRSKGPSTQRSSSLRLLDVQYPFRAKLRIGTQETDIEIKQPGSWRILLNLNQ